MRHLIASIGLFLISAAIAVASEPAGDSVRSTAEELKRRGADLSWMNRRLIGVNLTENRGAADVLKVLPRLPDLQQLDLSRTDIRDADLTQLAKIASLRQLDLSHTAITNAGLAHLATLPGLQRLSLVGTLIDDEGLLSLRATDGLQVLQLNNSLATKTGAAECLHGHRSLMQLDTRFCRIDENLGTSLQWTDSLTQACNEAREQDKLVFVIHVSGDFAIPEFT